MKGAGVVGSVTVSGLPQRADHELVVEALCDLLGRDYAALRLERTVAAESKSSRQHAHRPSSRSLDHRDKEAVGVEDAGQQAQRAFRREAAAQPLRAGRGQNAIVATVASMRSRKRNQCARSAFRASTAATTCSFSSGSSEQVE